MSSQPDESARVVKILSGLGATLATAESCTGGYISHLITNIPGASDVFVGGVVAYSNGVKTALLGVRRTDIEAVGAVSEVVARQMAEGVRMRLGATYGIGVTGVAGPGGGTPDKPVGLVYIAVGLPTETHATRNLFAGTRDEIKEQTAVKALEVLLEYIA